MWLEWLECGLYLEQNQEEEGSQETWVQVQGSPGTSKHCDLSFSLSVSKLNLVKAIPITNSKFEMAVILQLHAIMPIIDTFFIISTRQALCQALPAVSFTMTAKFAKDM